MACGPVGCGPCGNGPFLLGGGCHGCDGCGERYVDEWINHPPSCDSCDSCGNHGGQTCGHCRPVLDGLASLWGYRRDCGCEATTCGGSCGGGCSGGCDSGFDGGEIYGDVGMGPHYVDASSAIPMPHRPSPAPRIVEAKPAIKVQAPQRTKQIFRPRGTVAGSVPPRSY
ncbi:MAG: hypothetical protein ACO1RT_14540, partial [Planctomycetaceae bacterium]